MKTEIKDQSQKVQVRINLLSDSECIIIRLNQINVKNFSYFCKNFEKPDEELNDRN